MRYSRRIQPSALTASQRDADREARQEDGEYGYDHVCREQIRGIGATINGERIAEYDLRDPKRQHGYCEDP